VRLPEFTAEASLYRASGPYQAMTAARRSAGKEIVPQQVRLRVPLSPFFEGDLRPICICDRFGNCNCPMQVPIVLQ